MWILISRINLTKTRRRMGRRIVAVAAVIGTGVQMAMTVLPNPAVVRPDAGRSTTSQMCDLSMAPEVSVG